MDDDPDVVEERRRQAQAVAAEQSKAMTEGYRRPFGGEPTKDDSADEDSGENDAD